MSPIWQLTLTRIREFIREPAAIFWVYGFPLLMAIALGVAFRDRPVEKITVDLMDNNAHTDKVKEIRKKLESDKRFNIEKDSGDEWKKRLRNGKTDLVIFVTGSTSAEPDIELWDEHYRAESVLARNAVENALMRASSSPPKTPLNEHHLAETGSRYIDFLIPGLLGMNLMGGGLFGVGFLIVDMRVRKLLKRFLATPMKRSDFLLSIMFSRLIFTIPEVLLLLTFGYLVFDVTIQGNIIELLVMIILGAASFGGLGLLIACRAKTLETVTGLMNLAMLPMWVMSGVFFSSDKFPQVMQPFIQALPLTALNNGLRAIMLEGKSLTEVLPQIAVLATWGIVSYVIALKIFRWK